MTFASLDARFLYFPSDSSFPFFDAFWVDDHNNLHGLQTTVGDPRRFQLDDFVGMLDRMQITAEHRPSKIVAHCLPLRRDADAIANLKPGAFWDNVDDYAPIKDTVGRFGLEFHVIRAAPGYLTRSFDTLHELATTS